MKVHIFHALMFLVIASVPVLNACKMRQSGSGVNEISSGASGAGDNLKNCEELFSDIQRYKPKFDEHFKDYVDAQCDLQALSKEAREKGVPVGTVGVRGSSDVSQDFNGLGLDKRGDALDGVTMKPDPGYVQLVDAFDAAKTKRCQELKTYLEEKTSQLISLATETSARCGTEDLKAFKQGHREYIIVDHPTCGYFSRCVDSFMETNGQKCSRCWLDTYQQNFLGAGTGDEQSERTKAGEYRKWSGLTCSSEMAARDAVELFCNNIRPGSCDGPGDPKIRCEEAPARDRRHNGPKTISGGLVREWDGTEQSYTFTTKFGAKADANISAGVKVDAKVVEVNTTAKAGMTVTHDRNWNMALRVKSEVGLMTMSPPAMITRGGVEEGAPDTKFICGIEVLESSIDSVHNGVTTYIDVTVDMKGSVPLAPGVSGSVGTSATAGTSGGFVNASSSGKNKYRAFQSLYLTGAGMTREGMQAACDRYNAQNMHLILGQFLSSAYAKFNVWQPKDNYCRQDRDCTSGNGWVGRCRVPDGQTVGQCTLFAGHGTSCPTQTFSNRACDAPLGCKTVSWMSFLGMKFNRSFECRPCDQGKDAEGYCRENP